MGALLSLPLLAVPSITTIIGFGASCCGAATCSMVCSACGKCGNRFVSPTFDFATLLPRDEPANLSICSVATRIAYALILLVNSIVAWIMLTPWAIEKLQHLMLDYVKINCPNGECYGWLAVHRINFALGVFHLILAGLLFGVASSKEPRAAIQNGYWGPKVIAWVAFIVMSFLIPDEFFMFWGNYIALIGAMLFLLLGLILLVDLAHGWADMYAASLAMTIVQYIFFAGSGCSMNQAVITINLVFWLIISIISVNPTIQEHNPKAGLAQAAMVAVYCTYLTIIRLPDDDEHDLVTQQPGGRREMRAEALRRAVEEGSLPADALLSDDDDSEAGNGTAHDDERTHTQYNYSMFHIIFFLATTWVSLLLTLSHETAVEPNSDFASVGRTYAASWIKIVSAWLCHGIYIWSLVAPVVLPERFDFS
ncbi:hypothetical protein LLEC1_06038 [Akanthomyces lecanii]|uniref:Serine incorporator n=1 Tax=Cordyceps confragosa TaxID=2714763 RepID=A0A179I3A7_CORDF|nr:hypothetical protein LLEC1_06038 [Akanthomyces lecanii]